MNVLSGNLKIWEDVLFIMGTFSYNNLIVIPFYQVSTLVSEYIN